MIWAKKGNILPCLLLYFLCLLCLFNRACTIMLLIWPLDGGAVSIYVNVPKSRPPRPSRFSEYLTHSGAELATY